MAVVFESRKGRMKGLTAFFVFEPRKEGCKDCKAVLSLNQERKDARIVRLFCL